MCITLDTVIRISQGGLLTPVIGGVAVYIAWQQRRTSAYKLRFDLYDRRIKVFERVVEILTLMRTAGDVEFDELFELTSGTRDAEFLFGNEIKNYIEQVYQHAIDLHDTRELLDKAQSDEERERLKTQLTVHTKWAFDQRKLVASKFKHALDVSKL